MKVVLFGGSGMVGQGVLRECLLDNDVDEVFSLGRSPVETQGLPASKLRTMVLADLYDLSGMEGALTGFDACFFCLGVSSGGISEAQYRRITYELTISVARTLRRLNPQMTFEYVSGAGTDSTEKSRATWTRVKGQTENELLRMGFKAAYMLRPGIIQPLDGIRSKTKSYRVMYALIEPILPLAKRFFPKYVTSTAEMGRAMIRVAKEGNPKPVIEALDIHRIGAGVSV
jgi:uncharacterized protein YbjT (DUF2867 family)